MAHGLLCMDHGPWTMDWKLVCQVQIASMNIRMGMGMGVGMGMGMCMGMGMGMCMGMGMGMGMGMRRILFLCLTLTQTSRHGNATFPCGESDLSHPPLREHQDCQRGGLPPPLFLPT